MNPDEVAQALQTSGICVCPHFVSSEFVLAARADLEQLWDAGEFQAATTGRSNGRMGASSPGGTKPLQARRDDTYWLEEPGQTDIQRAIWAQVDALREAFNRRLFLGIRGFEGHYASYSRGGFYRRPLDQFQVAGPGQEVRAERVVSLILYLNGAPEWQQSDGGQLRIYRSRSCHLGPEWVDVQPVGGTLVCMMSAESEHEVLLSHRLRRSFTGWFLR